MFHMKMLGNDLRIYKFYKNIQLKCVSLLEIKKIYSNVLIYLTNHTLSHSSRLNTCDASTRQLWHKHFGKTYVREGAMFRCDPPQRYVSPLPPHVKDQMQSSVFLLQVVKVSANIK